MLVRQGSMHLRLGVLVQGIRCNCQDTFTGDFCQNKRLVIGEHTVPRETKPHVEYKQFDAETLAVISNLGGSSQDKNTRMNTLGESFSVAVGNRSQFVFCLTNPCENGGTCFVTNTATTKVG